MSRKNSLFGSPKARRPKASVKPQLEKLEDRTMPSATPDLEAVSATINQCEQTLTLVQQDISNYILALDNDFVQLMSDVQHLLDPGAGATAPSTTAATASQSG